MLGTDKYSIINIRKYLEGNPELGEDDLRQVLSEFSCPKNPDVEKFVRKNAIDFTKKSQSVTYLVFSVEDAELLGYFTIALKPLTIRGETVSNTVKRKLLRISELDEDSKTYTMSAFLIAQIGKNYANGGNERITGNELLEAAWKKAEEMQYMGGGLVVFLEANNEEKLLSFYKANRFSQFDTRLVASGEREPHELIQLLRLL